MFLFYHIGGISLFSWLAIFTTILAFSRSLTTPPSSAAAAKSPEELLQGVASHTHYMPDWWRGHAHNREVWLAFARLYQYRVLLLLQEILGCITTPLLLMIVMPLRASALLEFVRSFTVHVEGVGHVCSFATFDFERHGDTRFGAPQATGVAENRSTNGKMEKSALSFLVHHPSWKSDTGAALLERIVGAEDAQPLEAQQEHAAQSQSGVHHLAQQRPAQQQPAQQQPTQQQPAQQQPAQQQPAYSETPSSPLARTTSVAASPPAPPAPHPGAPPPVPLPPPARVGGPYGAHPGVPPGAASGVAMVLRSCASSMGASQLAFHAGASQLLAATHELGGTHGPGMGTDSALGARLSGGLESSLACSGHHGTSSTIRTEQIAAELHARLDSLATARHAIPGGSSDV